MAFRKLGLVYDAACHRSDWADNSALTPTPVVLPDGRLRVYAGFRDAAGTSRIGWVDLDPATLAVTAVSARPALDIGRPGCFDDNGVILGDIQLDGDRLLMFYVGFQLVKKAKFLAFTGLAESRDGGDTFQRVSESPVLDRAPRQSTIGAIHSVIRDGDRWRLWFAQGDDWEIINGIPYPQYEICHSETRDLLEIPRGSVKCVRNRGLEYRIGRPRTYRRGDGFEMYYTKGGTDGSYFPGKAYSADGITWERRDEDFELALGAPGEWDALHLCYPALVEVAGRTLMFYNGNHMGLAGFGAAERVDA